MNVQSAHNETLAFARYLANIAECKALVFDLVGEPFPEDAREMANRHRKLFEALANYVESDLRSLQRFIGADTARHPLADLTPSAIRSAVIDTWHDFVRPVLVDAEEYLADCADYERDPMAEHRLGKHELGLR